MMSIQSPAASAVKFGTSIRREDAQYLKEILANAIPENGQFELGKFQKSKNEKGDTVLTLVMIGATTRYIYKQDGSVSKQVQVVYPGAKPQETQLVPPGTIAPELLK